MSSGTIRVLGFERIALFRASAVAMPLR